MMVDLFPRTAWADPFRELRRFQEEADRLFGAWSEGRAHEFPPLNLWANEDGVVVTAALPGVGTDGLEITVHQNTLTLKGERPPVGPAKGATALRTELPSGRFSRTVTLPFLVEGEQVKAHAEGGMLMIHLPRPAADRPRRIRIATA